MTDDLRRNAVERSGTLDLLPEEPAAPAKDRTGAARARRYREKEKRRRDAERTGAVTPEAVTPDADQTENVTPTTTLLQRQLEVRIEFDAAGNLLLIQESWPDDDAVIIVVQENINTFIDRLTDALGIPSFP